MRKRLDDTTKSKDQAALIRKRQSRERLGPQPPKKKVPRLADLILPLGMERAIEDFLGPSVPRDIEESFIQEIISHRDKIESRRAKYGRRLRLPLKRDVDCLNSFLLNVAPHPPPRRIGLWFWRLEAPQIVGQRACFCIGKHCPRRDIEK
jgi:hypothetical protein